MKREDVFERLDPPSGGLARLRERMEPRASWRFGGLGVALSVAAVLLLLLWSSVRAPDFVAGARDHGGLEAVALGLAPAHDEAAAVEERTTSALVKVPTSNATVAFYWVGSTATAE